MAASPTTSMKLTHFANLSVFGIMVVASYSRLYFGLDLLDEVTHAAHSYSLLQGRLPFIDEWDYRQTSAFPIWPFVRLYFALTGDFSILYLRHLAFASAFLTSLGILSLRRYFSMGACVSAAVVTLAFVPYNIMSFNYLRHSFLGFVLSATLLFHTLQTRRYFSSLLVVSTLIQAAVILMYPTWFPATLVLAGIYFSTLSLHGTEVVKRAGILVGGVSLVILAIIGTGLHQIVGADTIFPILRYHHSIGHGGFSQKILALFAGLRFFGRFFAFSLVGVLGLLFSFRAGRFRFLVAALSLLCLFMPFRQGWHSTLSVIPCLWIILISGGAICLCWRLKLSGYQRDLMALFCLPSVFSGLACGWTSSAPFTSLAYGLFPGAVAMLLIWSDRVKHLIPKARVESAVVTIVVVGIQVFCHLRSIPMDSDYPKLDYRLEDGPFRGIYTSELTFRSMNTLKEDLKRFESASSLLFLYDFAGGYLLTPVHALSPGMCLLSNFFLTDPTSYHKTVIDFYRQKNALPEVVVRMKRMHIAGRMRSIPYDPQDAFIAFLALEERYVRMVSRSDHEVWHLLPNRQKTTK